jgi:hypothetical protein
MNRLDEFVLSYPYVALSVWLCSNLVAALLIGIRSRTRAWLAAGFVFFLAVVVPISGLV